MSLGFFTSTRTGELMSRLNNDVVGAQQAVTGTFVTLVSNVIAVVAVLVVMLRLQWMLTLLAVAILPLFIIASRRVGRLLRTVRREPDGTQRLDELAHAGDAERVRRTAGQAVR